MALDGGGRIAPARVAWRRYGPEPAQARAVVLLLHGISGSQQALAPVSGEVHPDAGWASGWLGPGAALDTRHTCVLAPNALGSCFGSSAPDAELPASFPDFTITDSVRLQAVVARAGRCAAGCGGGLFLRRLSGVPVGARSARATRAGAGAGVRAARRRQLERRDRVAAPGRRAAGRRCLGARAVGRGAAGRLMRYGRGLWLADAGAPEPGRRWTPRRAPGRRAFRPGRWPPCGRQPAAMTSATRSRPCARRCTGCAARRTCCFRPAMKPPCRPACIP